MGVQRQTVSAEPTVPAVGTKPCTIKERLMQITQTNGESKIALSLLSLASVMITVDMIGSLMSPYWRQTILSGLQGFAVTFGIFGILPLYLLKRRERHAAR
ncbi:putative transmembrane protein [Gregarina niphandrodes]|uniref:Transmembrane protein n=1 Tax=Gregarina niphandrodes TaxID=110365 RepID=A0A023B0Y8_GRENI|nr:putative transmembrane protein [Gregarina niphandrodes]EZG45748.1 putative transmembrane protein [Gregarina niphandrodes]|eukprot:XP_011132454.1 putative transmembrane protein [Gregarina niphandrodes]